MLINRHVLSSRFAVNCRCWPFTCHPTTMASPCRRRAAAARVRFWRASWITRRPRQLWPRRLRPARAYWCTTTRGRRTRTAWALWPAPRPRRGPRRRLRRPPPHRRPSGPRTGCTADITKNSSSSSSHNSDGRRTPPANCRTTCGPADGSPVSASRATCTTSTTIPTTVANCFRSVSTGTWGPEPKRGYRDFGTQRWWVFGRGGNLPNLDFSRGPKFLAQQI